MQVLLDVSDQTVADLLTSALEGGSDYWCRIAHRREPLEWKFRCDPDRVVRHIDYPLNTGGALIITTREGDEINGCAEWMLDRAALRDGLRIMAEKYLAHFTDVLREEADSQTGDVFLQCCLFGELIYG